MLETALIIMPMGSDPGYRDKKVAIARAVRRAGYDPIFPTYEFEDPRFKPSEFRQELERAAIVLVDLTGERPSCYFELGFAEALGRPIEVFAKVGTPIHQSAYRRAVRFYADPDQLEEAVNRALTLQGASN